MATKNQWWKQPEVQAVLNPQKPVFNGNALNPIGANAKNVIAGSNNTKMSDQDMKNVFGQISNTGNPVNIPPAQSATTTDGDNPIGKIVGKVGDVVKEGTTTITDQTVNPIGKIVDKVGDIVNESVKPITNNKVDPITLTPIGLNKTIDTTTELNPVGLNNVVKPIELTPIGLNKTIDTKSIEEEQKKIELEKQKNDAIKFLEDFYKGDNKMMETLKNLYQQDVSGAGSAATAGLKQESAMAGMSPEAIASMGVSRARDVEANVSRGLGELTAKGQEMSLNAAKDVFNMVMANDQMNLNKNNIDYNKKMDAMKQLLASGSYKEYGDMFKNLYGVDIDTTELKNANNQVKYSNLMGNINKMIAQGLSFEDAWKILSKDGSTNGTGLTETDVKTMYENTKLNTNPIYKADNYYQDLVKKGIITQEQKDQIMKVVAFGLTNPEGFTFSESFEIKDKNGKLVSGANFKTEAEADKYLAEHPNQGYTKNKNPKGWISYNDTTINNIGDTNTKINTLETHLSKLNIVTDQERIQQYLDEHGGKWDSNMTAKDWNQWDKSTGSYGRIRNYFSGTEGTVLETADFDLIKKIKDAQTKIDNGTATDADKKIVNDAGIKVSTNVNTYYNNKDSDYYKMMKKLEGNEPLTKEDAEYLIKQGFTHVYGLQLDPNIPETIANLNNNRKAIASHMNDVYNKKDFNVDEALKTTTMQSNDDVTGGTASNGGRYHVKYAWNENIYNVAWNANKTHENMEYYGIDPIMTADYVIPPLSFKPEMAAYFNSNKDRVIEIKGKQYICKGVGRTTIGEGRYKQIADCAILYDPATGETINETFGSSSKSWD